MPKTTAETGDKKITIRITDELHTLLVEAAKQDSRSLNSEIVVLLRKGLESRGD